MADDLSSAFSAGGTESYERPVQSDTQQVAFRNGEG